MVLAVSTLDATLVGDAYSPLDGAGAHAESDWEVYEGGVVPIETDEIIQVDLPAAATTWSFRGAPGGNYNDVPDYTPFPWNHSWGNQYNNISVGTENNDQKDNQIIAMKLDQPSDHCIFHSSLANGGDSRRIQFYISDDGINWTKDLLCTLSDLDATGPYNTYRFEGQYIQFNIGAGWGQAYNLTGGGTDTTLTLKSEKNLALLQVGDGVVQSDYSVIDTGSLVSQDYGPQKLNGTISNATWQTSVQKFYGGAADFTGGTVNKSISFTERDAFLVGKGDFTFSWWSYLDSSVINSSNGANNNYLFDQSAGPGVSDGNAGRFAVFRYGSTPPGDGSISVNIAGTPYNFVIPVSNIVGNVWQHYAVVRNGGVLHGYVNGQQVSSQACPSDLSSSALSDPTIGTITGLNPNLYNYKGYIQDILISKSAAWTSNFTPPGQMFDVSTGLLSTEYQEIDNISYASPLNTYDFTGASGVVSSVNTAGNTLSMSSTSGTWGLANTGLYAIGPLARVTDPPTNDPPDSNKYTLVDSSLADSSNLESYTPGSPPLDAPATYYSRVKYRDNTAAPNTVESLWSNWNEIST